MPGVHLSNQSIYLDYMSTTPVDPRVIKQMLNYLGPESHFGNPASLTHDYGKVAAAAVDLARSKIADVIHANPQEIVFTSGATESDNLAIIGAARFYKNKGKHLITMNTEHKAVLDSFHCLEKEGFEVSYLSPDSDGLLDLKALEKAIRKDTILVSIMHVNNEIGVIQDIAAIADLLHDEGIIFHVDAAQSAGKLLIDMEKTPIHLLSMSAHKIYGPKGVGALYVRHKPRIRLQALTYGGGHEGGLRSGTLATHQIVGMGEALVIAESERATEQKQILTYRTQLWNAIKQLPNIRLNGHEHHRIAGNLNVSFPGLDGDAILLGLHELAISTSSACTSASIQPSYVLRAIGLSEMDAQSSIRLSIGRFTTAEDIQKTCDVICTQITRLNEMSP